VSIVDMSDVADGIVLCCMHGVRSLQQFGTALTFDVMTLLLRSQLYRL